LKSVHQMALDTITARLIIGKVRPLRLRSQRKSAAGAASESTVSVCATAVRIGKPV
jgi:hypothetical protein